MCSGKGDFVVLIPERDRLHGSPFIPDAGQLIVDYSMRTAEASSN